MATHRLERARWQYYFDQVSHILLEGKLAEIEVAGLKLGDQIQTEWIPIHGLVYDPKNDIFEVASGHVDHLIPHPQDIYVDDAGVILRSVDVIDADGNHQIIKLREPMPLPAPRPS